jgi:mono/diheme cytochrome c family protein
MEPYPASALADDKLAAVVEYLMSLMGDEAGHVDAALAERGKKLFADDLDCNTCHEVKPGETGDGPNLSGSGTRAWIQRVMREASADDLYGKSSGMPKFGKKLTDEEIRQLADLIAAGRSAKGSG